MTGGVRRLAQLVESVHAVGYFAREPLAGFAALGLKGYWRGYFASRAAALGEASATGPIALPADWEDASEVDADAVARRGCSSLRGAGRCPRFRAPGVLVIAGGGAVPAL